MTDDDDNPWKQRYADLYREVAKLLERYDDRRFDAENRFEHFDQRATEEGGTRMGRRMRGEAEKEFGQVKALEVVTSNLGELVERRFHHPDAYEGDEER